MLLIDSYAIINMIFSQKKKKERNNTKIYLHESVRVTGNLYAVTRSNLTHANKQQKMVLPGLPGKTALAILGKIPDNDSGSVLTPFVNGGSSSMACPLKSDSESRVALASR